MNYKIPHCCFHCTSVCECWRASLFRSLNDDCRRSLSSRHRPHTHPFRLHSNSNLRSCGVRRCAHTLIEVFCSRVHSASARREKCIDRAAHDEGLSFELNLNTASYVVLCARRLRASLPTCPALWPNSHPCRPTLGMRARPTGWEGKFKRHHFSH